MKQHPQGAGAECRGRAKEEEEEEEEKRREGTDVTQSCSLQNRHGGVGGGWDRETCWDQSFTITQV